jgi:hypothetical protein
VAKDGRVDDAQLIRLGWSGMLREYPRHRHFAEVYFYKLIVISF